MGAVSDGTGGVAGNAGLSSAAGDQATPRGTQARFGRAVLS